MLSPGAYGNYKYGDGNGREKLISSEVCSPLMAFLYITLYISLLSFSVANICCTSNFIFITEFRRLKKWFHIKPCKNSYTWQNYSISQTSYQYTNIHINNFKYLTRVYRLHTILSLLPIFKNSVEVISVLPQSSNSQLLVQIHYWYGRSAISVHMVYSTTFCNTLCFST